MCCQQQQQKVRNLLSVTPDGSVELSITAYRRRMTCQGSALTTLQPSLAGGDMEEGLNKTLQSPALQTATCMEHGVTV